MWQVICAVVNDELAVRAKDAIAIEAEEDFLLFLVACRVAHTYCRANTDAFHAVTPRSRVTPRRIGHLDMELEYRSDFFRNI